ncbi:MAG: response regulator [Nitrososphaeraceae archaeon]
MESDPSNDDLLNKIKKLYLLLNGRTLQNQKATFEQNFKRMRYAIIILAGLKLEEVERYCEQIDNQKYFNISGIDNVANYLKLDYGSDMTGIYDELIKKGYIRKKEIFGNTYLNLTEEAIDLCNVKLWKLNSLTNEFSKDISLQKQYNKENLDSFDRGARTHTAKILETSSFLEKKVNELIIDISSWPEISDKAEINNPLRIKSKINNPPRIMVVDDMEDVTMTYTQYLQEGGLIVEGYNNAFEALQKFRESPEDTYDILLIDMNMPGMDGLELFQEIQNSDRMLPIIFFITAYETLHNLLKESFPEMNDKRFIRKPITQRDLLTKLKQELQSYI